MTERFGEMAICNGICWHYGSRKMFPLVPWEYKMPPLYFLTGGIKPKEVITYQRPVEKVEEVIIKIEGTLF